VGTFLVNLAKVGAVIEFTKSHGKEIPESIFRIIKEKPRHTR
jgi:hypothetical protein